MTVSSFRDQFMWDDAGHRELVQIVMSLGFGLRLGLPGAQADHFH